MARGGGRCCAGGLRQRAEPPIELARRCRPRSRARNPDASAAAKPLQCVPYAREHSGVKIHGDAWTWWDQAAGKFPRAVSAGSGRGHGADGLCRAGARPCRGGARLVSPREIRVDHANWLDDGAIYLDDPVADVSADNDWSAVRVWNIKTGAWGSRNLSGPGLYRAGSGSGRRASRHRSSDADRSRSPALIR